MSEPEKKSSFSPSIVFWVVASCVAIAFLAVVTISNLTYDRSVSPANACINNLRQIDYAAQQYTIEHHLTNGDRINFPNDLTPYIKLDKNGKIPTCPKGGVYSIKKVGDVPTCSLGTNITPPHVLP
jgi:hypothetical protein